MLSDIYDCAYELGKKITGIVINAPKQMRERTKGLERRLLEFDEQSQINSLDDFVPEEDEEYFVVPTTPQGNIFTEIFKSSYNL